MKSKQCKTIKKLTNKKQTIHLPLFLCLIGNVFGSSNERIIRLISDTLSFTFSWWAVKCAVTNRNDVPNRTKAIATAPFVLNAVPGRTEKLASSGNEQYQIRSRRRKTAKCNVPTWKYEQIQCLIICGSLTCVT